MNENSDVSFITTAKKHAPVESINHKFYKDEKSLNDNASSEEEDNSSNKSIV